MSSELTNFPREATIREGVNALNVIAIAQASNAGSLASWSMIKQIVRQGLGPQAYPVGTLIPVNHSVYGTIVRRVKGHNINPDPTGRLRYTMTTEMVTCIYNRQISNIQALYYVDATVWPDGLPAGTYNFTLLSGYDTAYGGGVTLQFAITQPVPVGGIIMFPWGYQVQATASKVSTYATQLGTTALEANLSVVEGSGGTSLGTANGQTPFMNHSHRIRYGSGNYGESAGRQWLNSDAGANLWFVAKTIFDRPPSYANVAGFLAGHDEEFLAALVPVDIVCARNTVYEVGGTVGGSYTLRDKMFLPSMTELGLGNNNGIAEGAVAPYYVGAQQVDRIRYDQAAQTTARVYWMRSVGPSYAYSVRNVISSGALNNDLRAYNGYGLAADCVIG